MIYSILVALYSLQIFSPQCSCAYDAGPFISAQRNSDLVAEVEVLEFGGYLDFSTGKINVLPFARYMDVKIKKVLRGKESTEIIRIYGDNGNQCRPYVKRFRQSARWIMALNKLEEPESGKIKSYFISGCGTYWLKIRRQKIKGRIFGKGIPNKFSEKNYYEYEGLIYEMKKSDFYLFYDKLTQ